MKISLQWPFRVEREAAAIEQQAPVNAAPVEALPAEAPQDGVPMPQNRTMQVSQMESWDDLFGSGASTFTGVRVNNETALRNTAVFACVRLLTGAIGSLPLKVYQRTRTGEKKDASDHPMARLLHTRPNERMTPMVWRECTGTHALLTGNSYCLIERNYAGEPLELHPVLPTAVYPYLKDGRTLYAVTYLGRDNEYKYEVFDQDDMLHLPGAPMWDGVKALSPIKYGAQSIGIALAAEEFAGRYFENNGTPGGYITYPNLVPPEQADEIRGYWMRKQAGLKNAHKPAVLSEGGKFEQLTVNAEDAQLLQTRQFQLADIARIYGVPPFMIGETEKQTSWGTGVEQQSIGFVTYTLKPHLTRFEQEITAKLFRETGYFAEFDTNGLLRGDVKTRFDAYRIARGGNQEPGFMSLNEIRKRENLPPKEGGDELYKPVAKGTGDERQADPTV